MKGPLILPDGSVPPHSVDLKTSEERGYLAFLRTSQNYALRRGYVVARHLPGESSYAERQHTTYEVLVSQVDANRGETYDRIHNVELAVPLGSQADQYHMSIRCPASYAGNQITEELIKSSSRVLVLCVDGRSDLGVIVGFAQNQFSRPDAKEDGHFEYRKFNGMEFFINNEGEYSITFTGETIDDETNKVAEIDPEVTGTYVKFTSTGDILLDNVKGESVLIDKANKRIVVTSRSKEDVVTDKNWTVEVQNGSAIVRAAEDIIIDGAGNTMIGTEEANEPLVLGNQLVAALSEFCDIFLQNASQFALPTGKILNPTIVTKLKIWQKRYAKTDTSPVLADSKFTE